MHYLVVFISWAKSFLALTQLPVVEDDNVVVFEHEVEKVINLLTGGFDELEVISIVGKSGLGCEILVWKLVRLWIAEGFIQPKEGMSLEDIGEDYLEDHVNMILVMVGQYRLKGFFLQPSRPSGTFRPLSSQHLHAPLKLEHTEDDSVKTLESKCIHKRKKATVILGNVLAIKNSELRGASTCNR
ncbi:hypothetical protein Salat_1820300 [Sesamum alatum]|uniref:Disease resistance protein winged helix domain-containing protein n=1 Tax=Sesamum alatum TaxID=300844 RepID=A0AAE1Y274_9LAMI|nr:hypothetical protein Salat_1820300 [Sesamum alatum]